MCGHSTLGPDVTGSAEASDLFAAQREKHSVCVTLEEEHIHVHVQSTRATRTPC